MLIRRISISNASCAFSSSGHTADPPAGPVTTRQVSSGSFSWQPHLQCHILLCGKAPLSILVEQTASGRVAACSGAFGRVVFDAPGTHVYLAKLGGADHNRKEEMCASTTGLRSYLTTPDVFLRTEAAKLWVTPTRLVPSTSTIWSFTLILARPQMKAPLISLMIQRSVTPTTAKQPDGRQTKQLIVSH